jgi:mono/diheme cytochrome c family protein
MTPVLANALLDLIDSESRKETSDFAGSVQVDMPELTVEDARRGREYFFGTLSFKSKAPACIGCHTLNSIPGYLGGGGRLGPNLSDAYNRLGEQRGLSAWLMAPPQPTMNPIFMQHPLDEQEVLALVAYLKVASTNENKPNAAGMGNFFIVCLLLVIALFLLFGSFWSTRFTGIRIKMIRNKYSSS